MTIGSRILKEMKKQQLSEGELARRSKVPQPTIHRIVADEVKSPRNDTIEKISKALNVEFNWLVFGKEPKPSHLAPTKTNKIQDDNTISIPLVADKNTYGYNIIIGVDMDLEALKKLIPCKDYRKLTGCAMPDDSMNKTINNGDPLLIDENYNLIEIDGIYKVEYGNNSYIRRFQIPPDGKLLMIADNDNYRDFMIDDIKEINVIGKVVYIWNGRRA